MNGPQHYREAERLVGIYATQSTTDDEAHLLAEWARVHATLALAAATAEQIAARGPGDIDDAWMPIIGAPVVHYLDERGQA